MLLGLTSSRGVDLGIIYLEKSSEEEFNIILSMKYLTEQQVDKVESNESISTTSVACEHMEVVDNKWVSIHPNLPNSIHFHSSIYNRLLGACDTDRMCVLHITD